MSKALFPEKPDVRPLEGSDNELRERVATMDERLTKVETKLDSMQDAIQSGMTNLNYSVSQLASEFGTRMNTLDQRIVEEKAKWGEVFRSIVKWVVRMGLAIIAYAAGINLTKTILTFN